MADTPVLSVQNLKTSFLVDGAWKSVIRDVSFDVMPGETVAIVGESGSGKSVTSLSIMRLLHADSSRIDGKVLLNGRDLLSLTEKEMRGVRGNEVSMIFQEPMTSLNPIFTIGRQISEVLTRHKGMSKQEARAETTRLLEKVRIPNGKARFDDYPHQFSGGMRQRVMIAMALASRPKLLTHDMGVVAEIADRTIVMYRGEQVEAGATEDIFLRGQHPYTRALLSAVPKLGSMANRRWPTRFPIVDATTGEAVEPEEVADTVGKGKTPILSVKNLTTRFAVRSGLFARQTGSVHAVENLSFDLFQGETLSLVGESGCGKSTTGRSIMRLVEPTDGEIYLDGYNVLQLDQIGMRNMRKSVQMIFQDPFSSLNPRMTAGASIAEPFIKHKLGTTREAREKAADLLERVGLSASMMNRYPHEFSGGQRQRIAIARALSLDPKVIVADESVSALDVSVKAQVCNLLLDLQQSLNLAFLFISHDMAVVERMSHRVAVMYLGEIVEIGPRAAVFENPQHDYTKKLIAAVPVPDPARRGIRRGLADDELKSPVRPFGYEVPSRQYREVSAGHLVQVA